MIEELFHISIPNYTLLPSYAGRELSVMVPPHSEAARECHKIVTECTKLGTIISYELKYNSVNIVFESFEVAYEASLYFKQEGYIANLALLKNKIHISRIPFTATREEVIGWLLALCPDSISNVDMPTSEEGIPGSHRGYCFVECVNEDKATKLMNALRSGILYLHSTQPLPVWQTSKNMSPEDLIKIKTVYIRNIPPQYLDEDSLHSVFSSVGHVINVSIPMNRSRCFGFVEFSNHYEARLAVTTFSGRRWCDKQLDLSLKKVSDDAPKMIPAPQHTYNYPPVQPFFKPMNVVDHHTLSSACPFPPTSNFDPFCALPSFETPFLK